MVKKRATKSAKVAKKAKSLPLKTLSAKKATGVKGGGLYMKFGGVDGESTTSGHEKWIE